MLSPANGQLGTVHLAHERPAVDQVDGVTASGVEHHARPSPFTLSLVRPASSRVCPALPTLNYAEARSISRVRSHAFTQPFPSHSFSALAKGEQKLSRCLYKLLLRALSSRLCPLVGCIWLVGNHFHFLHSLLDSVR